MVSINDARKIANAIAKYNHPHAILVFGSVARANKGNDLDLLIISKNSKEKKIISAIRPFCKKFDIDYFIIQIDDYVRKVREGAPFVKSIRKHGRILYMDHYENWKMLSIEDLNQAQYLKDGDFHRGACYHAQQSIEKCLKYVLLRKGWDLQKTHNVRRLIAIIEDYGIKIQIDDNDLDFIDSIYIGRYPADIGLLPNGFPDKDDSQKVLDIAYQIFKQLGLDYRNK